MGRRSQTLDLSTALDASQSAIDDADRSPKTRSNSAATSTLSIPNDEMAPAMEVLTELATSESTIDEAEHSSTPNHSPAPTLTHTPSARPKPNTTQMEAAHNAKKYTARNAANALLRVKRMEKERMQVEKERIQRWRKNARRRKTCVPRLHNKSKAKRSSPSSNHKNSKPNIRALGAPSTLRSLHLTSGGGMRMRSWRVWRIGTLSLLGVRCMCIGPTVGRERLCSWSDGPEQGKRG